MLIKTFKNKRDFEGTQNKNLRYIFLVSKCFNRSVQISVLPSLKFQIFILRQYFIICQLL